MACKHPVFGSHLPLSPVSMAGIQTSAQSWSLKFLYRNAPLCGLALSKQNICEISHKKLCDCSIMIEKASNALNKSSELWHSSSGRKARPLIGAFLYKNSNDHGVYGVCNYAENLFWWKPYNHINWVPWHETKKWLRIFKLLKVR